MSGHWPALSPKNPAGAMPTIRVGTLLMRMVRSSTRGSLPEPVHPEPVADDDRRFRADSVFVVAERPSEQRLDAQPLEVVAAHVLKAGLFGRARVDGNRYGVGVGRDADERLEYGLLARQAPIEMRGDGRAFEAAFAMGMYSPLWFSTSGGKPSLVHSRITSESGAFTGSGLRIAASTRLKIAALAPIPIASESTTASGVPASGAAAARRIARRARPNRATR